MNIKNKEKSIEKRLADIERWERRNIEKLKADFIQLKQDYMEAPGTYMPNINETRSVSNSSEIYTTTDYRLDMGHRGEFKREILNDDYINNLVNDGGLKVKQVPENLKLIDSELVNELKSMASLIKACERFVKNNPDTVVAFKDGLMALHRQYAEAISHLQQVHKLPVSDFLTNQAILRYNLNKFKISKLKNLSIPLILLNRIEFSDFKLKAIKILM